MSTYRPLSLEQGLNQAHLALVRHDPEMARNLLLTLQTTYPGMPEIERMLEQIETELQAERSRLTPMEVFGKMLPSAYVLARVGLILIGGGCLVFSLVWYDVMQHGLQAMHDVGKVQARYVSVKPYVATSVGLLLSGILCLIATRITSSDDD